VSDNAVVFGAEDYGLSMVEWLRRGGAKNVVVVDPVKKRQQAARELGATAVIDPAAVDVAATVREYMPLGADVSFVSLEDYIAEARLYLRQAFDVSRVQGTVVLLRVYGVAPYAAINPQTPHLKEVTLKHFGLFFGNEPIRGGRARGDWQVTLEAMGTGLVCPPPETEIFDFEDLKSKKDVDELFQALPHACSKAIVKIAGD
jgi:threonine dehydrogenase-like Zn-dependent dehydrogenase